jgi:iron complex outermembrane receptor protein
LHLDSACTVLLCLSFLTRAPVAHAEAEAGATGATGATNQPLETVVISATRFNAEDAPAKSSLNTGQPETILNRPYIEDFTPPQADYVTVLAIAPSLTGQDVNGPGLSDGNVKNTLRGIPDGNFGMSFDGVPFGDTNGPTHHSISYFPASTLGSILVDRGPGNAGTLGASTYGGTIKMFSEPLTDDMHGKALFSYGTWNTRVTDLNFQSGRLGEGTEFLINAQNLDSDGALTDQKTVQNNILIKVQQDLGSGWKATAFGSYSHLDEVLDDNNGATPAQVAVYGKDFALQSTNPALPTFTGYNGTEKATDLDYLRLQGDVSPAIHLDEKVYTYSYWNHTFSARSITQTITDINNDTAENLTGSKVPIVDGVKHPGDIPGYSKENYYRVYGTVLSAAENYEIGSVKGQVREGLWWEGSYTHRFRRDFDMTLCNALDINPFDNPPGSACADSSLFKSGKAVLTPQGYAEFDEWSGWRQYEPYLELEIHPVADLTLTPGVKYIHWEHYTDASVEPKLLTPFAGSFVTTKTLEFFEANYKIRPSWSVYAQYATGIYVPDISAFEQSTPVFQYPAAETTTNYQLGTVFYADRFTFDADVYYIPVSNNYVSENCSLIGGLSGETCFVNTGKATYKGIEAEGTYDLGQLFGDPWRGLQAFLNGSLMSSLSNGLWIPAAPRYTVAAGVLYKTPHWKFSLIDKTVGPQYETTNNSPFYEIGSYSNIDANAGFTVGRVEFGATISNLGNSRHVLSITQNDATYQPNRLLSTDQYFFQPERSAMVTVKARF